MKIIFTPLDYDYIDNKQDKNKSIIRIFGKDEKGRRVCIIDDFECYFYLFPKKNANSKKLCEKISKIAISHAGRNIKIKKTEILRKNFLGKEKEMIKIFLYNPKDIALIKDILKEYHEIEDKKEMDINPITRYIIDKKIEPLKCYQIEGEEIKDYYKNLKVDLILKVKKAASLENCNKIKLKALAFDIESSDFDIA